MRLNRISKWLGAMLLLSSTVQAQVTIPNTFTPNTTAQSALVNANFSQLGQQALNRAGGIITGNISVDPGITIDGIDIGAVLGGSGTPTFANITVTGQGAFTSAGAAAILVSGGITAGSGNVAIINTSGRIPAITSTYFASLDGAVITNITETNIAVGSTLARLAASQTFTNINTFGVSGTAVKVGSNGAPQVNVSKLEVFHNVAYSVWGTTNTAGAADEKYWQFVHGSNFLAFRAVNDANSVQLDIFTITRSATTSGSTTTNGNATFTGALIRSGVLSPATLASGNNNNYNPTGLSTAGTLVLTGNAANSILTGVSGGTSGRELYICDTGSGGTIQISNADTNSSVGNRFDLGTIAGASPRLRSRLTTADFPGPCMHFQYVGSVWILMGIPQET